MTALSTKPTHTLTAAVPLHAPAPEHPAALTVAIAIGDRLTGMGIQQMLSEVQGVRVTARASTVDELDPRHRVHVVIVDDTWAATEGARTHGAAVLLVTLTGRSQDVSAAILAGANGCVTRQLERAQLRTALETVAAGGMYLAPELTGPLRQVIRGRGEEARHGLATREIETLRLLAEGLTHTQIARRMNLTEATVNTYVKRIRLKLGAGNKAELTRKAIEMGYVTT